MIGSCALYSVASLGFLSWRNKHLFLESDFVSPCFRTSVLTPATCGKVIKAPSFSPWLSQDMFP